MAPWLMLYVIVCLAAQDGEAYVVANDFEQARSGVFEACARIVKASPLLRNSVRVAVDKITFRSAGVRLLALPLTMLALPPTARLRTNFDGDVRV